MGRSPSGGLGPERARGRGIAIAAKLVSGIWLQRGYISLIWNLIGSKRPAVKGPIVDPYFFSVFLIPNSRGAALHRLLSIKPFDLQKAEEVAKALRALKYVHMCIFRSLFITPD